MRISGMIPKLRNRNKRIVKWFSGPEKTEKQGIFTIEDRLNLESASKTLGNRRKPSLFRVNGT
jgi:hypothetical protein